MKKTFLATLSLCTFLTISAQAQENKAPVVEKRHHNKVEKTSDVDAKETALRGQIEKNTACATILSECKKLGFVAGGFKEGNGLWRNCFANVLEGKAASLKGKDVSVSANANDVSACKVVVKEVRKERKEMKAENGENHKAKHAKSAESNAPAPKQ